ncbi:MAG: tetratricopeptide repeat protein [Neisseria sp.]|uniref:tetratricopeptide repeat protein n=1 Tax=Neisseria sp. TaxID=192066 RepID=UPI0026DCA541|nr:tetratricopeptide repeat protein [Neisseria sp.]MDO4248302.1 tetratricopeptide repeat protein [Neisseria sp.]
MPFFQKRLRPLALLLMLACPAAGFASGAAPQTSDYRRIEADGAIGPLPVSEHERRRQVVQRAGELFTLFGGEVALQKGDAATALASYMVAFNRTQDPAVGERAMEMALGLHAYDQAEAVYRRWREIEPQPGAAQQRMAFARSLALKEFDEAQRGFDKVMAAAGEENKRKLFLQLSQAAVESPGLAKRIGSKVKRETKAYPDMPEAVIANAIFSALSNDERGAVKALQRLTELDTQIAPPTLLTLRLIGRQNPEILNRFFTGADAEKLSPMWRQLQVEALVHSGKNAEAYGLLQQLLKEAPDADLYMQAAFLAINQKAALPVVLSYLEQAYKTGTQEQRSRAAAVAAMRNADARNYQAAREWAARIKAPGYAFDKAVLNASIEAEAGDWQKARGYVRAAEGLPEQQGNFFTDADLFRLQIFAVSQQSNPRRALQELDSLYQKVHTQKNSQDKLADVLYQRAILYADSLNEPDKAVADLRRYRELRPDSAQGMNALGYTMLGMPQSDKNEAFELIRSAYRLEPEEAAINDSMGWAYFIKGDSRAALPYLEFAFEKQPDPEVAAHLGEVYWRLGEKDKARAVFRKGLAEKEGKQNVLRETMKRLGATLPAAE